MLTVNKILQDNLDRFYPEKLCHVSTNHNIKEGWMTPGILKCSKKQLHLYSEYISKKSDTSELKYKYYRNTLKKIKWSCRRSFYLEKCTELKCDSKKLWQLINSVIHKNTDITNIIHSLQKDSLKLLDSKRIVDELGLHFSQIGTKYADNIPSSSTPIDYYIVKISCNLKSIISFSTNEVEIAKIIDNLLNKANDLMVYQRNYWNV